MNRRTACAGVSVWREKRRSASRSVDALLDEARLCFEGGRFQEGVDLTEQAAELAPASAVPILAGLHDRYAAHPDPNNRYHLYVSRFFDFGIRPGDTVLDIGSGHDPFPFATHLADRAPEDDSFGRAGVPMRYVAGIPFTACDVEAMPFGDGEFDFVYCSHVLEHTVDPGRACRELMRVAKRGYVETPTYGKDYWLATARPSNHHWKVERSGRRLRFSRYREEELRGIGCPIILDMHCSPRTEREKAVAALVLLRSDTLNTMLYWEGSFDYEVTDAS